MLLICRIPTVPCSVEMMIQMTHRYDELAVIIVWVSLDPLNRSIELLSGFAEVE
jgi:hypothetical protein